MLAQEEIPEEGGYKKKLAVKMSNKISSTKKPLLVQAGWGMVGGGGDVNVGLQAGKVWVCGLCGLLI